MPSIQFWFTGNALFTIGSFLLFAILGFAGVASMSAAYRRLMLLGYAFALILFFAGWWQSAQQEQASAKRDVDFSTLQEAIAKIASSASISLNQSADQIAAAVIAKIQPIQKQVDQLSRRAPDEIYQNGFRLGKIEGFSQNQEKTTATFQSVTTEREIDFRKEIELENVRLLCAPIAWKSLVSSGAFVSVTYRGLTCKIIAAR